MEQNVARQLQVAETATPWLSNASPELWREYTREQIPPMFGHRFSEGSWNLGFVVQGRDVFLLVTLEKADLISDHRFDDGFIDPGRLRWQSQNRTTQDSRHGRIIHQSEPGYAIHLFVRPTKKRRANANPFIYCGQVDFLDWRGEKPITVTWALRNPVPEHLRQVLKIASD